MGVPKEAGARLTPLRFGSPAVKGPAQGGGRGEDF